MFVQYHRDPVTTQLIAKLVPHDDDLSSSLLRHPVATRRRARYDAWRYGVRKIDVSPCNGEWIAVVSGGPSPGLSIFRRVGTNTYSIVVCIYFNSHITRQPCWNFKNLFTLHIAQPIAMTNS